MKKIVLVLLAMFSILIISNATCYAQCYGIRGKENQKVWFKGTKRQCETKWEENCKIGPFHRQGGMFGVSEEEERKLHDELERKRIQQFIESNEIIQLPDEMCETNNSSSKTNCVTWSVFHVDYNNTYYVNFKNNCDYYVVISYEYFSRESNSWIKGSTDVSGNSYSHNNEAGSSGQIRNVRYTPKNH